MWRHNKFMTIESTSDVVLKLLHCLNRRSDMLAVWVNCNYTASNRCVFQVIPIKGLKISLQSVNSPITNYLGILQVYYSYAVFALLTAIMMTSPNGTIFGVTGPLCREFTSHRRLPRTKASASELWCFLWSAPWINGWVNNLETGDLRRHRAHFDVTVMWMPCCCINGIQLFINILTNMPNQHV